MGLSLVYPKKFRPGPVPIGSLINETFSSLGDWTITSPAGAFSASGGDLLINKAVGGGYNLNDYMLCTGYGASCLEDWTITTNFKVTEKSASCNGFYVGLKSTATFGGTNHHIVQFNTNSGSGKLLFYLAGATSATSTSSGTLIFAVNDECTLTLTRTADGTNQQKFSATVTNITNPNSVTHTHTFSEAYPVTVGVPPTSQFAIYSGVGTVEVHDYVVTTSWYKNVNMIAFSDSIARGLYAGNYNARWTSQVFSGSSKINYTCGGPGDRTTNALERINEIIMLNPAYVLLDIGGNDLEAGVAIGTVQTNYANIVSQLEAKGIVVYHVYPTPRNSYDFSTWITWLASNYHPAFCIDVNTSMLGSGYTLAAAYNIGDNVHLTPAGHTQKASVILSTPVSNYK